MSNTVQDVAAPLTRRAGRPAWHGRPRHRDLALGLILLAQLVVMVDVSIATLAPPAIRRALASRL